MLIIAVLKQRLLQRILTKTSFCLKNYFCSFNNTRGYASAVYAVVACLSVSSYDTRRYCTKMAKCRINQTTPYDSPV